MAALIMYGISFAQSLSGTKTIPGNYPTVADAITALNTLGVEAPGVTFSIAADYTETFAAPSSGLITATGTYSSPIVFVKNGTGANPVITAATVVGSTTADYAICLSGSDYVTFDGIDVTDPSGTIEWGYALLKASATDGVQHVTIKNCTITMNKINMATYAIYSNNVTLAAPTVQLPVTAVSGTNSSNNFYGNTITNSYGGMYFWGYADPTAPYTYYDRGNDVGSVAGNTFTNFAGGTMASYQVYMTFQTVFTIANCNINGGSGTGIIYGIFGGNANNASGSIYGNTVQITSSGTNSAIYGINNNGLGQNGTTNTINIYNNTVQNCLQTTTTGAQFYGVHNTATSYNTNFYGNVVNNNVFSGSGIMNLCSTTASTSTAPAGGVQNVYNNTVSNNQRTGLGTQSANSDFYCLRVAGYANTSIHDNNIFGNTIGPIGASVYGNMYSLHCNNQFASLTVYNNSIHDQTLTTASTSAYLSNLMYGIYAAPAATSANNSIYNNSLYNLTIALTSSGIGTIYGLFNMYQSSIYGNTLYNLNVTSTSTGAGYGYGYYLQGQTGNINMYNNKLYGVSMAGTAGYLYGIYTLTGANFNIYNNYLYDLSTPKSNNATGLNGVYLSGGTNVNLFYNTIYLNSTSNSTGTFKSSGIYAATASNVQLRNNIVVNLSKAPASTTYSSAAYRRSSTALTSYGPLSTGNDFYAGPPTANSLVFTDGTNNIQTLAAFKTFVSPRDTSSVTELPPFVNVATAPYDLHLQTTVPTQCESGGSTVSTPDITFDYDNDARYPNPGYPNNPLSPATASDIGADEFAGLHLDISPPTVLFTPFLNTSSTIQRTLTTSITDPSGVPITGTDRPVLYWKINSGTWASETGIWVIGNTFTFTFGAGVVLNDVVSYYIVAQDMVSPTPNIGSTPSAGAAGFTASPPACTTAPTTPYTYTIIGSICGTFNVGSGQTFTTLTAAIADLNIKEITCPVTFLLTDATYSTSETFPIVVNINLGSSAVNTVTIKTGPGNNAAITGSLNNGALLKVLNSNTIIDGSNTVGGTTRNLTISNTSITAPNVVLIGSTNTRSITNTTLKNCTVINGINSANAINISDGAATGTAGYFNNITIQNNSVQLALTGIFGIATVVSGNGAGLLITGNDLNTSGTNAIKQTGIKLQGVDGAVISNNTIGNLGNTNLALDLAGILISTGTVNSTVSGNTISGINGGGSAGPIGIAITPGILNANINVMDNTISGLTSTSSSPSYGIWFYGATGGCTIQRNKIFNIMNLEASGFAAIGIGLGSTLTIANTTVKNNLIYDVSARGHAFLTGNNGYGLNIMSGGGYKLYFNTIRLSTDQIDPLGLPACLIILAAVTTPNCLDIRNNIFYIDASVGTNRYAVICNAPSAVFSSIDYNDYYSSGPNLGYIGAANRSDLVSWQAGTGTDVNSVSINPSFVSLTYQFPTNGALKHLGTYLAAVPTDFNGVTRTNPPDVGAYEFASTPVLVTTAATGIVITGATLNGTVNPVDENVNMYFDYGLNTSYGYTVAGTPPTVSGNNTQSVSAAVTGLTGNTIYHYRLRGVTFSSVTVNGNDMTFTTLANPLGISGTVTDVSGCYGNANGAISTLVTGGVSPFSYIWSNGTTSQNLSGLIAGTFSVTVTDASSSTITGSWVVSQPSELTLSATTADASCPTGNDGSIDLTPTGGVPAYSYLWSNGVTTQDVSGLIPGNYTVTVTDNNVCSKTGSWAVVQISSICANISVSGDVTGTVCYNATNTITVAGGATTFVVEPTGSATFIAGVNIIYLPGTTVLSGGYMLGTISTGTYCTGPTKSIVSADAGPDERLFNINKAYFTIYPNPTNGNFTLVQKNDNLYGNVKVEVFSMGGMKVMNETIIGEKKHDFRFSDMATGLYFVKVVADGYVETIKLIKL